VPLLLVYQGESGSLSQSVSPPIILHWLEALLRHHLSSWVAIEMPVPSLPVACSNLDARAVYSLPGLFLLCRPNCSIGIRNQCVGIGSTCTTIPSFKKMSELRTRGLGGKEGVLNGDFVEVDDLVSLASRVR
jgi:hypothetical protein